MFLEDVLQHTSLNLLAGTLLMALASLPKLSSNNRRFSINYDEQIMHVVSAVITFTNL